jgi:RNA polymerase sigma-70 factor (ECF subfamily)
MKHNTETLFESFLNGCPHAFEELMTAMIPTIFRFFVRMGADSHDAEDLSQEFFTRLHNSAHTFRRGSSFRPWAWEIARNIHFRHHNRQQKKNIIYLRDWMAASLTEPLADSPSDPEFLVDSRLQITSLMGCLSQEKRIVFELRHFQGLPFSDIAETLDIPEGTVKSRMFNALRDLRRHLLDSESDKGGSADAQQRRDQ